MKTAPHADDEDVDADLWWWVEQATKVSANPRVKQASLSGRATRSGPTTVHSGRNRGKRTAVVLVNDADRRTRTRTPEGRWIIYQQAYFFAAKSKHKRLVGLVYWATVVTAITCGFGIVGVAGNGTKLLLIVTAALAAVAAAGVGRYRFTDRRDTLIGADAAATKAVGLPAALKVLDRASEESLYKSAFHDWWRQRDPLSTQNRIARLRSQFSVVRQR